MKGIELMRIISMIAMAIPVIALVVNRLTMHRTFPALLLYYILITLNNIFSSSLANTNPDFVQKFEIFINLCDAPLMLFFICYFAGTVPERKLLLGLIALLVAYELICVALFGLNFNMLKITLGPGLILVLLFSVLAFIRVTKLAIVHDKGLGKSIISATLIVGYGCFFILYIVHYLVGIANPNDKSEIHFIFYIVVTVTSLLLTFGLVLEGRWLKKLKEVKQVRKELSEVYKEERVSSSFRNAPTLDFDNELFFKGPGY